MRLPVDIVTTNSTNVKANRLLIASSSPLPASPGIGVPRRWGARRWIEPANQRDGLWFAGPIPIQSEHDAGPVLVVLDVGRQRGRGSIPASGRDVGNGWLACS